MGMKLSNGAGGRKLFPRKANLWAMALLCGGCATAFAQSPSGGVVTSGTAAINQSGTTTNINQSTNKASINWQTFSIGSGYTVNFNQPSASSVTLNRVVGNQQSVIEGVLNATGQVFLLNPNGVLLTKKATVNTGSFLATTLSLSDADFQAGNYVFKNAGSTASVVNQGTINASDGGYVALLGNLVSNQGVITATKGTVALAAGGQVTLNFNGDSLVSVVVDQGVLDALVENKQAIYADGGTVILTAQAADDLLSAQVNNGGIIQARTIGDLKGKISLLALGGTTTVDGTLDASAPNGGDGGTIETSGNKVEIADSADITTLASSGKTGSWIIDPDSFTIAASGGDITGASLSSKLASNSVSILSTQGTGTSTDGNIYVNDAISWDAATTLGLTATNNVYVNKSITASGDGAGLTLTATNGSIYDNAAITMSGSNDTLTMNANTTSGYVYIDNAITMSGDTNDAVVVNAKDYSILTSASYSGTTSDGSTAKTDTSNGVYGSLSFTSSKEDASGDSLTINGNSYKLLYNMSDLIATSFTSSSYKKISGTCVSGSGTCLWDTATQAYDITYYKSTGTCTSGSGTCYWNPATQAFDVPQLLLGSCAGGGSCYYDSATSKYDIPMLITTNGNDYGYTWYYDPYTKAYDLTVAFTTPTYYYDFATGKIDSKTRPAITYGGYYFYDSATGKYDVSSLAQLQYYALAKSIDVGGTTYTASPVSYFSGTLAGLGNAISNLTITNTGTANSSYVGLIGDSVGSVIRDLGLKNAVINVTNGFYEGALIGKDWYSVLSNDYVTGSLTNNQMSNGAFGYGGMVGYGVGTDINSSYTDMVVTSTTDGYNGGLVGYLQNGSIVESDAIGTATTTDGQYTGGLVGETSNSNITYSYTKGSVNGSSYVGGLIGYATNSGIIDYDFSSATVNATNGDAGGLIGAAYSYVYGSTNTSAYLEIAHDYATGTVTGGNAGGLVGIVGMGNSPSSNVTISDSYATGDVTGFNSVGGLVAQNVGTITDSYATGTVTATGSGSSVVGGLVGMDEGTITDSYATGTVGYSGTLSSGHEITLGSLAGETVWGGTVTDSYSTGNIVVAGDTSKGSLLIGSLVGFNYGTVSNSWTTADVTINGSDVTNSTSLIGESYSGTMGQIGGTYNATSYNLYNTSPIYRYEVQSAEQPQADIQSEANTESSQNSGKTTSGTQSLLDTFNPENLFGQSTALENSVSYADSGNYSAHVKGVVANGVEYQLDENCAECSDKNKAKKK